MALAVKSMLQLENYGVEFFRVVYPATVDHPLCTRLSLTTYHQKRWASFRVVVSHHLVSLKCRWIMINDISFIYKCHGFVHQPVGLWPYCFVYGTTCKLARINLYKKLSFISIIQNCIHWPLNIFCFCVIQLFDVMLWMCWKLQSNFRKKFMVTM